MSKFIWEIIPFHEVSRKNKFLGRLSKTGTLDLKDETDWPHTDVFTDEKGFFIVTEIAGISKDDLEVYIAENRLVIVGEKPFPALDHRRIFYQMERNFGDFKRIIELPGNVNRKSIQIELSEGVLKIRFL